MHGIITKLHDDMGMGVITADDASKYRFAQSEIQNPVDDLIGQHVDFELVERRPRAIILMCGSPWTAFGAIDHPEAASSSARRSQSQPSAIIDFTDLPRVSAADLALPVDMLINSGRGLALLRGLSEAELRQIDETIWTSVGSDDPVHRLAVVLRFRGLAEVFAMRRLQSLFLQHGLKLMAYAVQVAATERLNAERGFNVFKFERALRRALDHDRPAFAPLAVLNAA